MSHPKTVFSVFLFLLSALLPVFPQSAAMNAGGASPPAAARETEYEYNGRTLKRIIIDSDANGIIDYIIILDSAGEKLSEERDFNGDSVMDDFYFYASGVLMRREIDSNFDSRVDIWVHLIKGIYVSRYERDTDFDGVPDLVKEFGER